MSNATINLWGRRVGAVSWDSSRRVGVFQYDPDFHSGFVEVAPQVMPVRDAPYTFPALNPDTFHGLPGLLADALPDRYGNNLIDVWLAQTGRRPEDFSPVDRLCYVGRRGVGALEFEPALVRSRKRSRIDFDALVDLAGRALRDRQQLVGQLGTDRDREALEQILSVGTSAGGARAKAVLAWNPETGEFRSGQIDAGDGFENWLLKFDGVSGSQERELIDPQGYGRIEYAYHLMARAAGIRMSDCRLHHENGRSHFMTRRFDRTPDGDKLHMQSLGGMCHFDFRAPGNYSHEQAIQTIRQLGMGGAAVTEQFHRTIFNVAARNQDDHVKNIAFLMDRNGEWRLSPAYDVTYSYRPSGTWTRNHQMSLAGKVNDFTHDDLLTFANTSGVSHYEAQRVMGKVFAAVGRWREFANAAGVSEHDTSRIENAHRPHLDRGRVR